MKKNIKLHKKTLDLYVDDHGKQYIGKPKKKLAYALSKKEENTYNVFAGRYLLSFALGFFLVLQVDWKLGVLAGVIFYLVSEICYQKVFLTKLTVVKDVEFGEKTKAYSDLEQQPRMKNILVLIAIAVLIVLLFVNLFLSIPNWAEVTQVNNLLMVAGTAAIVLYCLYYGFRIIQVLAKPKKTGGKTR